MRVVSDPASSARYAWDARWDADQRAEAVALAERHLAESRRNLESVLERLHRDADWIGTVLGFKARADADELAQEVADAA
jgi:hypothetical protein